VSKEARSGVTAVSAGFTQNLALKDGRVLQWSVPELPAAVQRVPIELWVSGSQIAAGENHNLAIKNGKGRRLGSEALPQRGGPRVATLACDRAGSGAVRQPGRDRDAISLILPGTFVTLAQGTPTPCTPSSPLRECRALSLSVGRFVQWLSTSRPCSQPLLTDSVAGSTLPRSELQPPAHTVSR
jgi:hypothetical protein